MLDNENYTLLRVDPCRWKETQAWYAWISLIIFLWLLKYFIGNLTKMILKFATRNFPKIFHHNIPLNATILVLIQLSKQFSSLIGSHPADSISPQNVRTLLTIIVSLKSGASWSCSISVDSSFDVSPSNLLTKASWRQTLHNENRVKSCWWDKADEEHVIYGGRRGKRLISKLSFGCTAICQSCKGELGWFHFSGKATRFFERNLFSLDIVIFQTLFAAASMRENIERKFFMNHILSSSLPAMFSRPSLHTWLVNFISANNLT